MTKSPGVQHKPCKFRASIEVGISCLKRRRGLSRCTWKGLPHFKAYNWSSPTTCRYSRDGEPNPPETTIAAPLPYVIARAFSCLEYAKIMVAANVRPKNKHSMPLAMKMIAARFTPFSALPENSDFWTDTSYMLLSNSRVTEPQEG